MSWEKKELLQWDHLDNAIATDSEQPSEHNPQPALQFQASEAMFQDRQDESPTPFPIHVPHIHGGPIISNDGIEASLFQYSKEAQCRFSNALYAGYILLCFLSGLLMILTVAGPIVLYLFFTSLKPHDNAYGPNLFFFICNFLLCIIIVLLVLLTERKRPRKSLINLILLFTGACSVFEGILVTLLGFGVVFTSHVDWYLACNALVSTFVSAGQIYLLLFSCGLSGDHTSLSRTSLFFTYIAISTFSLLVATFRVTNLTNHNAVDLFHHTTDDLLKVMRILVLPVQIEFYFDTASHLYHLGLHISESDSHHHEKEETRPFIFDLKKIYSEFILEGVPRNLKVISFFGIAYLVVSIAWVMLIELAPWEFFQSPLLLTINESMLIVIEFVFSIIVGYPYYRILFAGEAFGLRLRKQSDPFHFSFLDQILYMVSTSCSLWFSGFNLYYYCLAYDKFPTFDFVVKILTHVLLVIMVFLQMKFLLNTICIRETSFTKVMRILLPLYNLGLWVSFVISESLYFRVSKMGVKSEVLFLFPFVLMYRFSSFGHSHQHFKPLHLRRDKTRSRTSHLSQHDSLHH